MQTNHAETTDYMQWYAIYTKPNQEERADSNLKAWKVETFNPRLKERRKSRFTDKPTYQIKPLFSRYIFARFNPEVLLNKVRFTRGVHDVVSFGKSPTPVDDEIISIIKSQVAGDGCIQIKEELNAGDKVMIKGGPFENFIGIFKQELKDADRVRILLTTVNYQSHIIIERDLVKKFSK
jgi:transcriptional antiterminator RfaH